MRDTAFHITLCVLLLLSSCSKDNKTEQEEGTVAAPDTIPMMVMQIKSCSKLYTAEYKVHKIVTHDDQVKLKGSFLQKQFDITLPIGKRKIAIPMDATLKAYIDFSTFSENNIRRNGNKIEITLPDPKVEIVSSRINHNEIKRQVALLRSGFSDEEITGYERQGRAAIINSIPQMGIIGMAQESAAHILIPLVTQLGYKEKDVTICFRKEFKTGDLPMIIDKKSIENGNK